MIMFLLAAIAATTAIAVFLFAFLLAPTTTLPAFAASPTAHRASDLHLDALLGENVVGFLRGGVLSDFIHHVDAAFGEMLDAGIAFRSVDDHICRYVPDLVLSVRTRPSDVQADHVLDFVFYHRHQVIDAEVVAPPLVEEGFDLTASDHSDAHGRSAVVLDPSHQGRHCSIPRLRSYKAASGTHQLIAKTGHDPSLRRLSRISPAHQPGLSAGSIVS